MDIRKISHEKGLTELEYSILEFILEDVSYAQTLGVRGIASENFTSTGTIIRLSKKLGFKGFTEMMYGLNRMTQTSADITDYETQYQPMVSLLNKNDQTSLLEISKIMKNLEDTIFINATGFSGIIGEYFYKKLLVKGNNVVVMHSGDSIGVFDERLKRIRCYLAISKSGETPDILEKAKKAKDAGIKIIAFTASHSNSLSILSDYSVVIGIDDVLDDRNINTNYFFSESIMAFEYILGL